MRVTQVISASFCFGFFRANPGDATESKQRSLHINVLQTTAGISTHCCSADLTYNRGSGTNVIGTERIACGAGSM